MQSALARFNAVYVGKPDFRIRLGIEAATERAQESP
jgi:hypothetical protein